jgi:phospho-2-dehydro-3-deoxyheptonate aldolase
MRGEDDRMVVIVGPCSIHDQALAAEYAACSHRSPRSCRTV